MSISCRSLDVSFDGLVYLENVDITIPENKIVLLYGPSGSGKTTLFNILSGLSPTISERTRVFWSDYAVTDLSRANKIRYRYISVIYSHFYFLKSLN